jgi:hypothetical protein
MSPGTTVVFSVVIDRQSVSTPIVTTIRDGWTTINDTAFVTDDRIALSLCPTEGPANLVAVRIRCVSVLRTHPHMYPRISGRLDVSTDMYVKDHVVMCVMQCETW